MSIIVFFPKKTSKLRTRLLIPLIGLFLLFGLYPMAMESAEAGTPPGYKDLDHLVSQFPSKILKEDDEYHVLADISLPATQPLFMGPGERVLFDEDVKLNLSAPPLFMGTEEDIISLGPLDPEKPWGGIYILERDPSTSTIMENVSITGSMIGIWSDKGDLALKNLQLRNNTRSGVEVRGPLGTANSLMIEDVEIINSHYYGIHLLNVADVNLKDVHMLSCGTSIRAVESELRMSDIEILESNSYGIYLKDSDLSAYELELSSTQGSNTNQIASMNSSITIGNGTISGSTIAIHIYSGSSIDISSTTISDCFVDGIKMEDSEATLTGTIIENCERNAMEIHGSILELSNVQMVNNGAGSGDLSYSSIYSDSSEAHIEDCLFTGSGYSHFEVLSSDLIIVDSILGSSGNNKITMEGGSIMTLVDILPPSNIEIKDDDSFLEYHLSFRAKVHNYTSEINIEGATVDIQDYDGNWILSTTTGSDGYTNEEIIPISRRTREGTFTYLPMTIVVQKEGYEVSTITMEGPVSEIEIALYPPNAPPTISIIEPANGTTVEGELLIEGTIEDDLGVHMIRYRFDSAVYRTVTDINVQEGGAFSFVIGTEDLSSDKHTLYLHAFDGSHISRPDIRTVYVISSGSKDSDRDGIPDMDEDTNGNGIVDQNETDPNDEDTDDDGLLDGLEIDDSDGNTTDPLDPDSDGDFLRDGDEDQNHNGRVDEGETDPNNEDTDEDGVIDSEDLYPLDSSRVDEIHGDGGSMMILAMAVLLFFLVIITAYLLYVRTKDGARNENQVDTGSMDRSRYMNSKPPRRRRMDEHKKRER